MPPFLWCSNTSSLGNVAVVAPRDGRVIVASYRTTTASTCTTLKSIDAIHVHDDVSLSSWCVSTTSLSISRIGAQSDAAMHRVRRRHALAFGVVTSWGPIPPVHISLHVQCSFDSCHTSRSHDTGMVSSPSADANAFVQHSRKTMQAAHVKTNASHDGSGKLQCAEFGRHSSPETDASTFRHLHPTKHVHFHVVLAALHPSEIRARRRRPCRRRTTCTSFEYRRNPQRICQP